MNLESSCAPTLLEGLLGLPEACDVPINDLIWTRFSRILTYPVTNESKAKERIGELSAAGVTSLRFVGSTLIDGIPILGKGCVGIVTQAILDGMPVALKIRRDDADRPSMANEGRLLRLANSVDVGPQLVTATRNLLAMSLFNGLPLFKWVQRPQGYTPHAVKKVLKNLLASCFRLDSIGLDHGELSRAPKNVLVSKAGTACIVDFETASTVRRVSNVTSLIQYFLFGRISGEVRSSRIFPRRDAIIRTLSAYKREPSRENFQRIIDVLGLA